MKRIWVSLLMASVFVAPDVRADVGPPPRDDCNLLAPGSPCWVDGKRRGACVVRDPDGTVVCAAGVTPTRAIASAKPLPSAAASERPADHPPVPWCAARTPSRHGGGRAWWACAAVFAALLLARRDRRVYARSMRNLDER
jgi:hypothetical protein